MDHSKRNLAIVLIVTGLFLLIGKIIGFYTVTGISVILLAVYMLNKSDNHTAIILILAGIIIIASHFFMLLFVVGLLLVGIYYIVYTRSPQQFNFAHGHRLLESWKQTTDPWVLQDTSRTSLIGEVNLDLSLAIYEKEETIISLGGIIGDVDIIVPDDVGISVELSVFIGDVKIGALREEGFTNNIKWQSPQYNEYEHKVKLMLSYMIGDINIKIM